MFRLSNNISFFLLHYKHAEKLTTSREPPLRRQHSKNYTDSLESWKKKYFLTDDSACLSVHLVKKSRESVLRFKSYRVYSFFVQAYSIVGWGEMSAREATALSQAIF